MEILHTYWLRLGRFRTVKRKQRRAKIKGDKHHCQWQGLPTTARKMGGDQLYDQAGFQSRWNQEAGRTAVVEERLSRARRIPGLQSTQYSVLSTHWQYSVTTRSPSLRKVLELPVLSTCWLDFLLLALPLHLPLALCCWWIIFMLLVNVYFNSEAELWSRDYATWA